MKIFTGNSTKELANDICKILQEPLGNMKIDKFRDGELLPVINESVRNESVFIIQSTHSPAENIIELLLVIDALKRSSAKEINCIIPYFGYGRQDRNDDNREPIGGRLMIDLIEKAISPREGRIITIDLHAIQMQGFTNIPFDHIPGHVIFKDYIQSLNLDNIMLCSPDVGGTKRAKKYLKIKDGMGLVLIDKDRVIPNQVSHFELIGDVTDKNVIVIDDMVDTGGTLFGASNYLLEKGAKSVRAIVTHPLFSSSIAFDALNKSSLTELVVTDSIYHDYKNIIDNTAFNKLKVISLAPILAKIIQKVIS